MHGLRESEFEAGALHTTRLIEQGRKVLAQGDFDGMERRPLFDADGQTFPFFGVYTSGCRIHDSSGRVYIDWVNRWGPILLGYQHPVVSNAIVRHLDAGPMMTLMHPVQIEVATALCDMVPSAEMVAFGKNGSDACCAAARLARAVTGRQMILQHGFHGFHDWCMVTDTNVQGVPDSLRQSIASFPYNNLQALEGLLQQHQGQVAAVMMEPVHMWLPKPGYLEGVRELADQHGALLIFDEMVTSFRLANGGAQEYLGVTPDLTCLGKGMGNGMPLSALVGKRKYMQHLPCCGIGMCFQIETLSLAVAKAVLAFLQREPVVEHIARVGKTIRERFGELSQSIGVDCSLEGPDARTTFVFRDTGKVQLEAARTLLQQECLRMGVLTHGSLLPSYAHDDEAIESSLNAFSAGLQAVGSAMGNSIKSGKSLEQAKSGSGTQQLAQYATGFFDQLAKDGDSLQVCGWLFLQDGPADKIQLLSEDGTTVEAGCIQRPDLEKAFQKITNARDSGFDAILNEAQFVVEGRYRFTLVAFRADRVAFRCLVVVGDQRTLLPPFPIHDGVLFV